MERSNFDNALMEQLERRKIMPSDAAWKKLEAQLTAQNQPQKRNTKTYYWIAASLAILMISAGYFLNITNDKTNIPVVERHKKAKAIPAQEQEVVSSENTVPVQKEHIKESTVTKSARHTQEAAVLHKQTETSGSTAMAQALKEEEKSDNATADMQREAMAIAETRTLLAQARIAIAAEQLQKDSLSSVNAMALLADVEEELDRRFKDKVFEALKENFYKLKTAVATRND